MSFIGGKQKGQIMVRPLSRTLLCHATEKRHLLAHLGTNTYLLKGVMDDDDEDN